MYLNRRLLRVGTCLFVTCAEAGDVHSDSAIDHTILLGSAPQSAQATPDITAPALVPCPQGSAYDDGCQAASAGEPALSTLLTRYKVRPPWNVAGVDFDVGLPRNMILKDPRKAPLPSGCSLDRTTVTCSGAANLDGYDFSLNGGTTLLVKGGDVTIQNCLFVVGSNQGSLGRIVDVSGASNATFLHNEFDGANLAVTAQRGQTIGIANTGTIIFRYNYFHNSGGDMVDFSAGPQVELVQYNLFKDIGLKTAHSDTLQWCGSIVSSADLGFNTVLQTAAGLSGMGLMVANSECPGAKMSNVLVHNNTLISRTKDNFAVGATVSQDAGRAEADHIAVFQNYVDPTGIANFTASPWFPTGYYHSQLPHPSALHSLIDMRTGSTLPLTNKWKHQSAFSTSYYVYPDTSGYTPALSDIYSVSAYPSSGMLSEGDSIIFVLEMDEPWNVRGIPKLLLNSGGVASYLDGSGTAQLRFAYKVGRHQSALHLAITAVDLNGGSIKDGVGNPANMAGALSEFSGLGVR